MNWIERLARLGYVSVGAVYVIIGGITAVAATHGARRAPDRRDAFFYIFEQPFGDVLLMIGAAGLIGYALWRLSSGFFDSDHRGSDAKGIAIRIGSVTRGVAYGAAAFQVLRLATHHGGGRSSDASAKSWTARAMGPFGRWAVGVAGLIIIGAGIYQITRAVRAKLSKRLDTSQMSDALRAVCRFGIAARGVVFGIIGWSVVKAGLKYDANKAEGTSGALGTLAAQPFGRVLLLVVAIGLIAYGVYAFVNARYRRIEA